VNSLFVPSFIFYKKNWTGDEKWRATIAAEEAAKAVAKARAAQGTGTPKRGRVRASRCC
jgi:hypothetical protein